MYKINRIQPYEHKCMVKKIYEVWDGWLIAKRKIIPKKTLLQEIGRSLLSFLNAMSQLHSTQRPWFMFLIFLQLTLPYPFKMEKVFVLPVGMGKQKGLLLREYHSCI